VNVEEYYRRYVISGHDADEHHFVAVCLCPTIKRILNIYPDYVNPDGMKRKHGDLIYKIHDSKVGIEVKLKIRKSSRKNIKVLFASAYGNN